MQYTVIDTSYQYDVLAENIYNREVEYYFYDMDKKNIENTIAQLPDGPEKESYQHRLALTVEQMNIVENFHAGLLSQITDQNEYDAAVARAAAKRAA